MSIYELIAGKLPFPSGEVADVLRKHQEEDPMPPSVFCPDLPGSSTSRSSKQWRAIPTRASRPATS